MYKINKSALYRIVLITAMIQVLTGCKKFVEIGTPPDKLSQENVFSTDRSATTALTGIYGFMFMAGADMAKYGGLMADECTLWSGGDADLIAYYNNTLFATGPAPSGNTGAEIWNSYYNFIFRCNAAIEGITGNNNLTPAVQKQLLGEAYFLRAWFYFYLVNLYGELPLAVGTDPEVNRLLSRATVPVVYQLITNDLIKAEELLNTNYVNGQLIPYSGAIERVRPTHWAATALLSRVYLYMNQYAKAEEAATKVIANSALFRLLPLGEIFLKNSVEAIWQLQPIKLGWNTWDAKTFHLSAFPEGLSLEKPVHLSSFLLNAFESGDQRHTQWVNSFNDGIDSYYFAVKYKIGEENGAVNSPESLTEYSMVLRLGEQYLIRAEARAKLNNLSGAIADLDEIRGRANLPLIADTNSGISQSALLDAILHERQVELFTEWGHRWFDLKRTGKVNEVMGLVTPQKGGNWENTDQLLPIPYNDLLYNPRLTQNAGY